MSSSILELSLEQCHFVSGAGIGATMAATGTAIAMAGSGLWITLEVMHLMLGLREFINYSADRSVHGCQNIAEGDYFTEWACAYISPKAE